MRRLACLVVLSLLVISGLFPPGAFGDGRVPAARGSSELRITDLSTPERENLSLRSDGGVELARVGEHTGLPEQTICSAANVQEWPTIAMAQDDTFLVAWEDGRTGSADVYGQRYDSDFRKLGGEIPISTHAGDQKHPAIGIDSLGNFIAVMTDMDSAEKSSIAYRRISSGGDLLGDKVKIDTSYGLWPRLARIQNDTFLVVWSGYTVEYDYNIFGQLIDSEGNQIGDRLTICGTQNYQSEVDIAAAEGRGYIVAWDDHGVYPDNVLLAQAFHSNGTKKGNLTILDRKGALDPRVAMFPDGSWAASWIKDNYVILQMFDAGGVCLGDQIRIFSHPNSQSNTALLVSSVDELWMCWHNRSNDGDLYARRFNSKGEAVSGELPVVVKSGSQWGPAIAVNGGKDLFVAWADFAARDVSGRRFAASSFAARGVLVTQDIPAPADLARWSALTAGIVLPNATANSIQFDYSIDGGAGWTAVPAGGSLAGAGSATRLRLRATFATTDGETSPVLYNITLGYERETGPPANHRPVVTAGPDLEGFKNTTVVLTATGSDEDGDSLAFSWVRLEGEAVQLGGQGTSSITFVPARSGVLRFRVSASDGVLESLPALVNVTVRNRAPAVTAPADIAVWRNDRVFLNASGSDPDGDGLVFTWTQAGAGTRYLDNFTGMSASFVADRTGTFTFLLTAYDGESWSPPAFVNVTVFDAGNLPPVVSAAGNVSGFKRGRIDLACTGSDPEGKPVSFTWTQVEGAAQALNGPSAAAPWFVPDRSGTFRFRVTASDGTLSSLPAYVNVTVLNRIPAVSVNGSITCHKGDTVLLRANGVDPDGDPLAFTWTQAAGGHRYFENRTGAEISFKAVQGGTARFRVVANDGEADGPAAEIEVRVLSGTEDLDVAEYPFWVLFLVLAVIIAFIVIMIRQRMLAKKY